MLRSLAASCLLGIAAVAATGNLAHANTVDGPARPLPPRPDQVFAPKQDTVSDPESESEPGPASSRIGGRLGVDAVTGVGVMMMIGAAMRYEHPAGPSTHVVLRSGHVQFQHIESESRELYPLFLASIGLRQYLGPAHLGFEGGALFGPGNTNWEGLPSFSVGAGVKISRADLGISLLMFPGGGSLIAHLGADFLRW